MKALLLGGAGFIGVHLARRLVSDGDHVTIVDDFSRGRHDPEFAALSRRLEVAIVAGDLTQVGTWERLGHGWEEIYMLAAVVGVRNVEGDPTRTVKVNSLTALNLMDWALPGERVFFASTSEVYAGGVDVGVVGVPTAEDAPVVIADVTAPRFAYAISKLLGEAALLHAAVARGLTVTIGRFHNVYGPRMGADHVIPEMSLRALRHEDPFLVWGSDQSRAFCYVDDAVEAIVRLMRTPSAAGEIVHVGDDTEETNIGDLARIVLRVAGVNPTIQNLPAPPGSVARRCPDISKLRRLTGYEPTVPLEEGVRRTVEWYRCFLSTSSNAGRR